jgi:hypothetical protein
MGNMKEFIITKRGVKNKLIEKINDPRLTPTMKRTRAGSTQLFREPLDENGERKGKFADKGDPDVIDMTHSEKHVYAELVDGEWYWVNGCCECNGEKRDWVNSYIECDKHDVCSVCGISTYDEKVTTRWGNKEGWICNVCHDRQEEEHREYMLANAREYSEWEFQGLNNIECPYCNEKIEEFWKAVNCEDQNKQDVKCHTCKNTYKVTPIQSITFDIIK